MNIDQTAVLAGHDSSHRPHFFSNEIYLIIPKNKQKEKTILTTAHNDTNTL